MKKLVWFSTSAAIIAGIAILWKQSASLSGVLFITPFSLGPLFVTLILGFFSERKISLLLLMASTAAYAAWFSYIYLDAFYWHLDPQSGLAFLFMGVYSLPVMLPLWVLAFLLREAKSKAPNISTNQFTSKS